MDNGKQKGISIEEAKKLAQSEAGQKLYSALQQTHGDKMQEALTQISTGQYDEVKKTLSEMLNSPEIKKLFRQMGGAGDG